MSRTKYSPEKKFAIMATFIRAANDILKEEGVDRISARYVASRAGYSSTAFYQYFDGIDQLTSMASVGVLREYITDFAKASPQHTSMKEEYISSWEIFCKHAFDNAAVFVRLFFNGNIENLDENIKSYYKIFPEELDSIPVSTLPMLLSGDLYERNMNILRPYLREEKVPEHEIRIVNNLTVCYFRKLLEEAALLDHVTESQISEFTRETLDVVKYLLP